MKVLFHCLVPEVLVLLLGFSATANAFVPVTHSHTQSLLLATPSPAQDELDTSSTTSTTSWKHRGWSKLQQVLWPGAQPDPLRTEPLPPGSLGCPFFGSDGFLSGNKVDGPGCFFPQQSAREDHPNIVKFYFVGTPVASVSGASWVQLLSGMEFSHTEALSPTYNDGNYENDEVVEQPSVFGNDNLLFERNKEQHAFLRRLVGTGMSATAVKKNYDRLLELATKRIQSRFLTSSETINAPKPISMEKVCAEYTLDITQNLILGLDLPPDEVAVFREKMVIWLGAMYSPIANLNIPWIVKHTPEYHARHYIQAKVEAKVDYLLQHGPKAADNSVLSNMVFARDSINDDDDKKDKNGPTKLTRKQIIENSMLLMITASETTAGTLTLMMFLLGLHPDKYQKLVEEQQAVMAQFGASNSLTQDILEHHCPYLNAVKQETMRMGALTGGYPKRAKRTIVADGVQIPKGWSIFCNIRLTHMLDPVTRLPDNSHMCVFRGFHPERWFQEETTPTDFLPFGTGPRYCIGAPLANLEIQLFLATLARRVESFDLSKDYQGGKTQVEWNPSTLTPRPSDGVMIQNIRTF